ncbi:hypothetical protein JG688_00009253 [Phytophthora aleatoria]|uniref:Uncharacterized protein n=1 Tax=Phytophthora aleatoria TaxID=2496075 RepID=A0A8J5IXH0_9STRA|nr:hypothetical protein JG688_00009253 [Phytophthora aleatoria]
MLQHIEWVDDCLVIEEQGHKGDQTGAEKFGKHVYANSYEPSQCPILAAGVHLFSRPERVVGGKQQLFLGTDNKNRFGRMLRRVIDNLSEEEVGVLSLRKGSSSYALEQVNGSTPVSRMGQSLEKLKDRYIHFGEGADQLCGRMIAELPFNSEKFGVLPPHFPRAITEVMTCSWICQLLSSSEMSISVFIGLRYSPRALSQNNFMFRPPNVQGEPFGRPSDRILQRNQLYSAVA